MFNHPVLKIVGYLALFFCAHYPAFALYILPLFSVSLPRYSVAETLVGVAYFTGLYALLPIIFWMFVGIVFVIRCLTQQKAVHLTE